MSERRRSTRQKSFLRGSIHFNNRRSVTDCLVRDLSAAGARLIFSDAVNIPDVVDLHIPQKEQTLRAQVRWRHGDEVGVTFGKGTQAPDPAKPIETGELAERVTKLEAEIAALKKVIKRLKSAAAGDADEAA